MPNPVHEENDWYDPLSVRDWHVTPSIQQSPKEDVDNYL